MQLLEEYKRDIGIMNSRVGSNQPTYEQLLWYLSTAQYMIEDKIDDKKLIFNLSGFSKGWADRLWEFKDEEDMFYRLKMDSLLFEAPYLFESYLLYMEKDRPYEKRFYEPRSKTLKVVVDDLQDLEDDKIKFYGLSMPSRVGKSTICIFFLSWIMGKRPDGHNAMGGHSGLLAKGFYGELLNLIDTQEYNFKDIFPDLVKNGQVIQRKSADEFTINLGKPGRFSTMTCRGIDGTWTGAIDISPQGYLYVDDLVRDREHSLSPMRMENTYQEYLNKMVDRMNDGAKQLMVGTLWSVLDPLSRIEQQYGQREDYRFRKIPALNENDESNFDYEHFGFSTGYYHEMRDKLDNAEWMAKFQQAPYVREGLLFEKGNLREFNGFVPKEECTTKAVVDVAFGGGDSVSMPIALCYPNGDSYIVDWIFSNGTTETTVPLVGNAIIKYGIPRIVFEKNNGGELYKDKVVDYLQEKGYSGCLCECRPAPVRISKVDKIMGHSEAIKSKFLFLDNSNLEDAEFKKSSMYVKAMEELCSFVTIGKTLHDDAADSLAQLAIFIYGDEKVSTVSAIKNPFRGTSL